MRMRNRGRESKRGELCEKVSMKEKEIERGGGRVRGKSWVRG